MKIQSTAYGMNNCNAGGNGWPQKREMVIRLYNEKYHQRDDAVSCMLVYVWQPAGDYNGRFVLSNFNHMNNLSLDKTNILNQGDCIDASGNNHTS